MIKWVKRERDGAIDGAFDSKLVAHVSQHIRNTESNEQYSSAFRLATDSHVTSVLFISGTKKDPFSAASPIQEVQHVSQQFIATSAKAHLASFSFGSSLAQRQSFSLLNFATKKVSLVASPGQFNGQYGSLDSLITGLSYAS